MNKARQKEELYGLIGLYGFFILGLIAIDMFYSAWAQMPGGFIVLAIIAHVGVIGSATILFKEWQDPKFDKMRKFFFLFWLAAVGFVAGYRVAKNEFNMFQDDVDKAKQSTYIIKDEMRNDVLKHIPSPNEIFVTNVIHLRCCEVMYLFEYHGVKGAKSINMHSI